MCGSTLCASGAQCGSYRSQTVLRSRRRCLLTFIQKAMIKYRMIGEPSVKNEMYIKDRRMLLEAIPSFSPNMAQTPKA